MSQATALTTAKRNLIRQTIRAMPTSRLVLMLANAEVTSTFLRDHVVSQHRQDLQWAVQSLSDELDARVPAPLVPVRVVPPPVQTPLPAPAEAADARSTGVTPVTDSAFVAIPAVHGQANDVTSEDK